MNATPELLEGQLDLFDRTPEEIEAETRVQEWREGLDGPAPETTEGAIATKLSDYYIAVNGMMKFAKPKISNERFLDITKNPDSSTYKSIKHEQKAQKKDIRTTIAKAKANGDELKRNSQKYFSRELFRRKELVSASLLSGDEAAERAEKGEQIFEDKYFGRANKHRMEQEQERVQGIIKNIDA